MTRDIGKAENKRPQAYNYSDTKQAIQYRIMRIISYSAAVANTIGFLANFFLYGMSIPTAYCGGCAVLVFIYIFLFLHTKHYFFSGCVVLSILITVEFPLLAFAYGSVMYPYMVLGLMSTVMLVTGLKRYFITGGLLAYYLAVIVMSQLHPFIFGEQEASGLLGSAIITFTVAVVALSFCMVAWQSVSMRNTLESDNITGSLSRMGFLRKAGKLIKGAPAGKYAVLCFDARSFKAVNTVYGTETGNRILAGLAEHIKNADFMPIFVGRFRADRFFCITESGRVDEDYLNGFCHYLYTEEEDKNISVSLSYGSFIVDDPSESIETVCDKAETVIRFNRSGKSNTSHTYNEEVERSFSEETQILGDIENSIKQRHFEPFYQPIVDCRTGRIASAEALARWMHPEKGIIYPGTFIPVLEQKEMIPDLDYIILSKVNELECSRKKAGLPMVPVAANLSRVDLFNTTFVDKVITMMVQHGIGDEEFHFEVTESSIISMPDTVYDVLNSFRSCGAKILVDDFGSGYSSLGMISGFDFDLIKLDKQFSDRIVENDKSRRVIKSVIDLAHGLGAKVIAEGIETAEQVKFLRESGCDYIQGYYFYRPMPESDFIALLDSQN